MRGSIKICQRGSNFDMWVMRRERIQVILMGHCLPASETPLNGVSQACRWWPKIECWLGSFAILQGSGPVLLETHIFVIFQGGPSLLSPPIFWIRAWGFNYINSNTTLTIVLLNIYMQYIPAVSIYTQPVKENIVNQDQMASISGFSRANFDPEFDRKTNEHTSWYTNYTEKSQIYNLIGFKILFLT